MPYDKVPYGAARMWFEKLERPRCLIKDNGNGIKKKEKKVYGTARMWYCIMRIRLNVAPLGTTLLYEKISSSDDGIGLT